MSDKRRTNKLLELPNGGSRGLEAVRRDRAEAPDLAGHLQTLTAVVKSLEELERIALADAEGTAVRVHCLQIRLFLERALLVQRRATAKPV